jgi:hypothetical protein
LDSEEPFSIKAYDGSNIVQSTIMEEGCVIEGYTVAEDGSIVRMARLAEDLEETGEHNTETTIAMPTEGFSCGHHSKIGSKGTGLSGRNTSELMWCHSTC